MQTATEEVKAPDDVVEVKDLGQFTAMLQAWHKKQVATLHHLSLIPMGTTVQSEGEADLILTGDVLRGYQMGISISLAHLGELPFNAEFVDPDATKH